MPKATDLIPEDLKEIYEHWKSGGDIEDFHKALDTHFKKQARRTSEPVEEIVVRGKGKTGVVGDKKNK